MINVTIEDLLLSGAHFGHLTRRWNPKMKRYIFMERNGIHIIDLKKTYELLTEAKDAINRVVTEGRNILFIGKKKSGTSCCRQFFCCSDRYRADPHE